LPTQIATLLLKYIISVGRLLICIVLQIAKTDRSCRTVLSLYNQSPKHLPTSLTHQRNLHTKQEQVHKDWYVVNSFTWMQLGAVQTEYKARQTWSTATASCRC